MGMSDEQMYWAAVRTDFKTFLQQAFQTLYPTKDFLDTWHIDAIVHHLMESRAGHIRRLAINLPPRHLKSCICSVAWPAFLLGCDPTVKVMCVSYSDDLVKSLANDFRRVLKSAWYRRAFPEVKIAKDSANDVVTEDGGCRLAISVGGSLTGRGADFIIIDDPIKPVDALSDNLRNGVNDWFKSTLLSRLDDQQHSVLTLVMQRVHMNDLTGFMQDRGGVTKLALPAIAPVAQNIALGPALVYRRVAGELLQPELQPLSVLQTIRDDIGKFNFCAQYLQAPEMPNGDQFKREWFQLTPHPPKVQYPHFHWVSIDAAASNSERADYSAITEVYIDERGFFVLGSERGHWDYEALLERALRHKNRHPEIGFVIENAGPGISLYQHLAKRYENVFKITHRTDKQFRAGTVAPVFRNKNVFVVNEPGNTWVEPFIAEFMAFPRGRHDDQVDSLVTLMYYLRAHQLSTNFYSP
jgi:predicted phage terminase large subunit-like protein